MKNKTIKNAAWIIGCRLVQSVLGLVVTMISARCLEPSGYGLINYAASIVAFFVPIMQLGFNATLVQELVDHPEQQGQTMGTALLLCGASSLSCILGISVVSLVLNLGETKTIIVCILYSVLLIFQSIEMIQYWFQAKLLSKYTSVTILLAYVIISAYRIILLVTEQSIYWYAISQALDFAIIAITLLIIFKKISNIKLSFSWNRAKKMLSKSKHYILSGLMITVFAQTDRVMLKAMIDESAVGFYSAAVSCASLTAFVFVAIIDSARPTILQGKKESTASFKNKMKILFFIVIFLALSQSAVITIFAPLVIRLLYGSAYGESVTALRIIVWYTTFSYLGAARDVWILSEGKQKYLPLINLSGALANVVLNGLMIPFWGVNGAAIASLITQIFTNVIIGWIIKPIRPCNKLMLQSLDLKFVVKTLKNFLKRKERVS